jgi:hypothetical protein
MSSFQPRVHARAFLPSGWTEVGGKVEWLARGPGIKKTGLLDRAVGLHLKFQSLCPYFVWYYLCFSTVNWNMKF